MDEFEGYQEEEEQETKEQRQKRYEEFYKYATTMFNNELKRMDDAEAKAARLFPVIVLLFGVGSIGLKEAVETLKPFSPVNLIFLIPYVCFYLAATGSVFPILTTLAVQKVQTPPIVGVDEYFNRYDYLAIIYAYGRVFLEHTAEIRTTADTKYAALNRAYLLLVVAVILGFISTVGYCIVQFSLSRSGVFL